MAIFFTSAATAGNSDDFTVVDGTPQTVFLTKADTTTAFPAEARMDILVKSTDNQYTAIGCITPDKPALQITAAATYRLVRIAASAAYGAEKV